jgi:hypothetical protein
VPPWGPSTCGENWREATRVASLLDASSRRSLQSDAAYGIKYSYATPEKVVTTIFAAVSATEE